jgi:hypothetical protein
LFLFAKVGMDITRHAIDPGPESPVAGLKALPVFYDPVEQTLRQVFAGIRVKGQLQKKIIQFHMIPVEQFRQL